jgi:hypothetical protein
LHPAFRAVHVTHVSFVLWVSRRETAEGGRSGADGAECFFLFFFFSCMRRFGDATWDRGKPIEAPLRRFVQPAHVELPPDEPAEGREV